MLLYTEKGVATEKKNLLLHDELPSSPYILYFTMYISLHLGVTAEEIINVLVGSQVRKGKKLLSLMSHKSAMFAGSCCAFLWRNVSVGPGISGDRPSGMSQAAGR